MGDLLHALYSKFEHFLDLGNNFTGIIVIVRDQLIRLSDQVELEERLWVLVPCKILIDLLLDFFGPGELVIIDSKITIRFLFIIFRFTAIAGSLFLWEFVLYGRG